MSNFNNYEYQKLVSDLIGDVFYTETSYRGKISTIRQYAEVIVRKILDIGPEEKITLGNTIISERIKELPNHEIIEKAIEIIRPYGNNATHTQYIEQITEEDFDKVVDSLLDMLSYMLVIYFCKYDFGTRKDVMTAFSLLPPIIRYKVLVPLYASEHDNIMVIDKLVLAILKSFDKKRAIAWVEKEKTHLSQLPAVSKKVIEDSKYNPISLLIVHMAPPNMYECCKEKIRSVGETIECHGKTYSNFEDALSYYQAYGILTGDDLETKEFNDIMNFLYLGRKALLPEIYSQ